MLFLVVLFWVSLAALAWTHVLYPGVVWAAARNEPVVREQELEPGVAGHWFGRGAARTNLGDHAGAVVDTRRAIALGMKDPRAWRNLAISLRNTPSGPTAPSARLS